MAAYFIQKSFENVTRTFEIDRKDISVHLDCSRRFEKNIHLSINRDGHCQRYVRTQWTSIESSCASKHTRQTKPHKATAKHKSANHFLLSRKKIDFVIFISVKWIIRKSNKGAYLSRFIIKSGVLHETISIIYCNISCVKR